MHFKAQHAMKERLLLLAAVLVLLVAVPSATADAKWGGLTEQQAVTKTKQVLIGLALTAPHKASQIAALKWLLDHSRYLAKHVQCNGRYKGQAWGVEFAGPTGAFTSASWFYVSTNPSSLLVCRP
jgi:hypothetical protein